MNVENFNDPNWATANVYYTHHDGTEEDRGEIVNTKTMMRYKWLPRSDIRATAATLATVGIASYTVANIAFNVIRAVTLIFSLIVKSFANFFTDGNPLIAMKKLIINLTYEVVKTLAITVVALVKAPFCAIAMEFCAIGAIISPLDWRVRVGDVERFWRGTDRFDNMSMNDENFPNKVYDFFTNNNSQNTFFLAYCFQPWGSLNDSHIVDYGFASPDDGTDDGHSVGARTFDAAAGRAQMRQIMRDAV
jgi:hypothetical protein